MPTPKPVRTSGPTFEPITATELKTQVGVDSSVTDFDTLIGTLIQGARETVELDTGLILGNSVVVEKLDGWPEGGIELGTRPVQSITSIAYLDTAGASQTLSSGDYELDLYKVTPIIRATYGATWPATRSIHNAITVTYAAGWATVGAVPQVAKQMCLLLGAHWFKHRELLLTGTIGSEIAETYQSLVLRLMRSTYP